MSPHRRPAAAVLAGEHLAAVAARYDVDADQLMRWVQGLCGRRPEGRTG